MSWLHRHTEVITKTFDAEGRAAVTVRVAPDKAVSVRMKFARITH
jgi:hypothetical protein